MTLDEFKRLAETWGGDIARWPADRRAAAAALAERPAAAALLAEATHMDGLLSRTAPQVADDRAGRASYAVIARLAAQTAPRPAWTWPRWLMPVALACAALIGLYLGLAYPIADPNAPQDGRALLTMIFDSGYDV